LGFKKKVMVAIHQSWNLFLDCLWSLYFCPSCYGSFNPSSCGGKNSSSKKEFDMDSPSMDFVDVSFKEIYDYQTWSFIFYFFIHDFIYNMFYFL
jgi:hypothetical protein